MKEELKKINWFYFAIAALYLALGLVCVIIPGKLTAAIPYIIGSLLIINGILRLVGYFINKNMLALSFTNYAIAEGILDILLGIIMFINTAISLVVVAVIIGIWALISGILNINYAINKSESKPECILNFVFAATQIVIGIILFFNFSGGIAVSIVIVGIYFIFLCVSTVLTKIVLFNKFNKVQTTVERALDPTHMVIKNKPIEQAAQNLQNTQLTNNSQTAKPAEQQKTKPTKAKTPQPTKKEPAPQNTTKKPNTQNKTSTQKPKNTHSTASRSPLEGEKVVHSTKRGDKTTSQKPNNQTQNKQPTKNKK